LAQALLAQGLALAFPAMGASAENRGRGGRSGRGRGGRKKLDDARTTKLVNKAEQRTTNEEPCTQDLQRKRCGWDAWEGRLRAEGFSAVAGTDEAGRGPLAGPVVAAAFVSLAPEDEEVLDLLSSVADSKQLTAAQRDQAYEKLTDARFQGRVEWAVAVSSVEEIDGTDILRASLGAMARAVRSLESKPECVLVDGCNRPPELLAPGETWTRGTKEERRRLEEVKQMPKLSRWFVKSPASQAAVASADAATPAPKADATSEEPPVWRPRSVEAVIGGDALVPSISAASVIAKVHRDRLMQGLHEKYPNYGFASHQGYGTAEHLEAIKVHGPCPEHRRSFGPVREALGLEVKSSSQVETADVGQRTLSGILLGGSSAPQACDAPVEDAVTVEDGVEPQSVIPPTPNGACGRGAKTKLASVAEEVETPAKRIRKADQKELSRTMKAGKDPAASKQG